LVSTLSGLPYLIEDTLKKYPDHELGKSTATSKEKAFSLRGRAQKGDPLAIEIFDFQARALGLHIANLAMALEDRGAFEEALTELVTAHQQAPDDEMIHHELACCLIDLERYPEAIGHLKQIVKGHPQHVEAFVDLGIAYTAQGFFAEAEGIFERALAIDDHDFATHYHLAALYSTWGRLDDALSHLEVAATHDREKVRTWVRDDRLFDPLREHARYLKLVS